MKNLLKITFILILGLAMSPNLIAQSSAVVADVAGNPPPTVTIISAAPTTISATPTTQATNVNFDNINYTNMGVHWTRGNGANCAVFMKLGSSGSASPVDNTTYTASSTFGSGTQIGSTGWYCIFNGTGTDMGVSGLTPGATYQVHVCEYNEGAGSELYLIASATNNPRNATTLAEPTTQASSINFDNISTTGMGVHWTRGNGENCAVFMIQGSSGTASPVDNTTYTASSTFGSGSQIGSTGWYCIYKGTGTDMGVSGLSAGTTYRVHVCEYNRGAGSELYLSTAATNNPNNGTTITTPTVTTSACSTVTTTSATLGGNVTDDGGASVTDRGVVYSSSDSDPYIGDPGVTKDDNGSGTGPFSESIGGLSSGQQYYFKAYAINSVGTTYGAVERCTTLVDITFTNGEDAALDFQQTNAAPPETNWVCGQFSLNTSKWGGTLNSVTLTLGGTYDPTDLESAPFQLYAAESNNFASAGTLGVAQADPGSGGDLTFSGLSYSIVSWATNYFWVTADIAASATADDNMNATIDVAGDLSISGGALNGSSTYGQLNAGDDASLPVELSSLSAESVAGGVLVQWTTESEVNNLGFVLERAIPESPLQWKEIASYQIHSELQGQGNTSSKTEYQFTDENVKPGETYSYRLSDVNTKGDVNILDVVTIALDNLPEETALEPPFPNPFNPQTKISYQLAESGRVEIVVYDMLGRKVSTLLNMEQGAGSYNIYWHGKDDFGQQASTGTYILRLIAGEVVQSQKVLLMR
ncbi:T9SS type A sorting domain-containing protein [candidate division KSB1 bacterium]|nr:T9SS type A sorting domain-containing protein [candidate division KSB1 bacterium]